MWSFYVGKLKNSLGNNLFYSPCICAAVIKYAVWLIFDDNTLKDIYIYIYIYIYTYIYIYIYREREGEREMIGKERRKKEGKRKIERERVRKTKDNRG